MADPGGRLSPPPCPALADRGYDLPDTVVILDLQGLLIKGQLIHRNRMVLFSNWKSSRVLNSLRKTPASGSGHATQRHSELTFLLQFFSLAKYIGQRMYYERMSPAMPPPPGSRGELLLAETARAAYDGMAPMFQARDAEARYATVARGRLPLSRVERESAGYRALLPPPAPRGSNSQIL